jgi:hypothetical protein
MIINHGDFLPYKPDPWPKAYDPHAMFCKNDKSDWYLYLKEHLDNENIKLTVLMNEDGKTGQVMAATKDATMLFPQHMRVLELTESDWKPETYVGKIYDVGSESFSDPEPTPVVEQSKVPWVAHAKFD